LISEKRKDLFFNVCGWRKTKYDFGSGSKRIVCNNLEGSINGSQSHTQRIEKDTVLIVVLRNVKEAVYENEIALKWDNAIASPILSILYNEDYELTKISGAFTIFKTLIESDQKKTKSKFIEIEKQQDKYYFDNSEFQFFYEEL